MPLCFFHLTLELYSTPTTASESKRSETVHLSSSHRGGSHSRSDVFLPTPGQDIFRASLPTHRRNKWTSADRSLHGTITAAGELSAHASLTDPSERPRSPYQRPASGHAESPGDALLLPERSLRLKRDTPPSPRIGRSTKPSNEAAAADWRYDAIEIESIDMEARKIKSSASGTGGLHTKAVYLPSDLKTTEVGWGVVHLYRDAEESSILDEDAAPKKGGERSPRDDVDAFHAEDCTTLCILAVPSWMMPSDLLGFVGDQAREDVSHFRLIRTGRANKYMVLMKFRSAKKARDWQKAYNGRLFSAAEPENCHVVFIKSVEFLSPDADNAVTRKFPLNTNDPFTPIPDANQTTKTLSNKPRAPPPPNLLELPTCPVCLERMDETTGLLTILCQHVFHCNCLEKWRGSGCPVCRYTHSPSYTFPYPRPQDEPTGQQEREPLCSACAGTQNLWICLICGNIGCGRYDEAHAFAHYEATSHCYAMDINTQHVWDYAGDGYVHRLIQSKPTASDPQTATTTPSAAAATMTTTRPRHENEAFRSEGSDSVPREKMESMATEYTYLLTSQLEGQRRYFEEQVERAVDKAAQASLRADEAARSLRAAVADADALRATSSAHAALEARLEKSDAARQKSDALARDLARRLRDEQTMADGLLQRIRAADRRADEAEKEAARARSEKAELEELNRDLSMFISGQEKVKALQAQGEDVVDGSVSVPAPPDPDDGGGGGGAGSEKKKKKGKGKK